MSIGHVQSPSPVAATLGARTLRSGARGERPESLRLNDDPSRLRLRAMAANARNQPGGVIVAQMTGDPKRDGLSEEDERLLQALRKQDADVRRHEEAHRSAAGALYRGGPYYEFVRGPDGKHYAVAGSVSIDTSPGRTPAETAEKAARIRRAASAPRVPSLADRAIAAQAARMEAEARRQLLAEQASDRAAPEEVVTSLGMVNELGRVEAGAVDPATPVEAGPPPDRRLDVFA